VQNRFIGDIGDFGKYGMLICIGKAGYRIGVNWYLTDNGEDSAGNLTDYLQEDNPAYLICDEDLYKQLYNIVYILKDRSVKRIEQSSLLPENTVYYSANLKSEKNYRTRWFQDSLIHLSQCPILFLDPDNNILLNNTGYKYDPEGSLYTFPSEIEAYYRQGQSIIVYNHLNRDPKFFRRFDFLKTVPVFEGARVFLLRFNRKQVRYYLFLLRPEHSLAIEKMVDQMLEGPWGKKWKWEHPHFEKYEL
jgi:hypothetical protein